MKCAVVAGESLRVWKTARSDGFEIDRGDCGPIHSCEWFEIDPFERAREYDVFAGEEISFHPGFVRNLSNRDGS